MPERVHGGLTFSIGHKANEERGMERNEWQHVDAARDHVSGRSTWWGRQPPPKRLDRPVWLAAA